MNKRVLITGSAGFIGFHLSRLLLELGYEVLGVDNFNEYYDVSVKRARNNILEQYEKYDLFIFDIETRGKLQEVCRQFSPDVIVHLAAQAGVRYSIDNPRAYFDANLTGTFELLEAARNCNLNHLLMASTSSAYGANDAYPYAENDKSDWPMSFYAATKKSTEVLSHSYAHIYGIPITAFRFFTVYGPWGRPDMALFKFTRAILEERAIDVYNHGNMKRDFTYVLDLVTAVEKLFNAVPQAGLKSCAEDSTSPVAPWRVVNIGNGNPVELSAFIEVIEKKLGISAIKNLMDIQPGDVPETFADNRLLRNLIGALPTTNIETGIGNFVDWYRGYYDA